MSSNVEIVPFSPAYRHTFAELWVPWLKQTTGNDPELEDQRVMDDPQAFYIASGGSIFFALIDSQPLGVVAVRKLSPQVFEFCKLVVLERGRGLGVGRQLVEACLQFSRENGGTVLMLQSFRKLVVALGMYKRMGFEDMEAPHEMVVLKRTEVVMGLTLTTTARPGIS